MAFNTIPLNEFLISPITIQYKDKVNISSFGNRYEQAVDIGTNAITIETDISFSPLTVVDRDILFAFLRANSADPYYISNLIEGQTHLMSTVHPSINELKIAPDAYKISWKIEERKIA